MTYRLWRQILFRLDPETAHRLVFRLLRLSQATVSSTPGRGRRLAGGVALRQRLWGLNFDNPVGLAAGMDKDGTVIPAMTAVGFGSLEVGTVTPRPQEGNPRPRLFRHPLTESLENAMGFNNAGLDSLVRSLGRRRPWPVPIGVNLGKNKATPNDAAEEDYLLLVRGLDELCDYFVFNVSSPNTPGLRDLQTTDALSRLIEQARRLTAKPLLIKLAPDLESSIAVALGRSAIDAGATGVVLTNTTTDYSLLPTAHRAGGLSGGALRELSYRRLREVGPELYKRCTLVSVGGIDSAEEAYRRVLAGASLVQLYSALVFRGPSLIPRIVRGLSELLARDGYESIGRAVGADYRG